MKRLSLFSSLIAFLISIVPLQADILLDQVMSRDDQKKTGVANLSMKQKIALEAWLNENFVLKTQQELPSGPALSLSINIDNGQRLMLSDNSMWEVAPNDVPTAAVWIIPFPVKLTASNDPTYPTLIVNTTTGVSVKARRMTDTDQTAPTAPAPSGSQLMPPSGTPTPAAQQQKS